MKLETKYNIGDRLCTVKRQDGGPWNIDKHVQVRSIRIVAWADTAKVMYFDGGFGYHEEKLYTKEEAKKFCDRANLRLAF